jgi:hypothetical protein
MADLLEAEKGELLGGIAKLAEGVVFQVTANKGHSER